MKVYAPTPATGVATKVSNSGAWGAARFNGTGKYGMPNAVWGSPLAPPVL